jgi:amino-acid N-acetyltransferase
MHYVRMFRGKTFVVGMAGEAVAAGKLQHIAQDLALIQSMGVKIVLVHGFRPQVTEQLKAKGHAARYSHGMRITDEVALDSAQEAGLRYVIEAAFSNACRTRWPAPPCESFGNFITARPISVLDGVDFQHSGWCAGSTSGHYARSCRRVVWCPRSASLHGGPSTSDGRGRDIAIALQADKLIFLAEIPGIRIRPLEHESDDNPIDTELLRRRTAAGQLRLAPTDGVFQHCVRPARPASSATTSSIRDRWIAAAGVRATASGRW